MTKFDFELFLGGVRRPLEFSLFSHSPEPVGNADKLDIERHMILSCKDQSGSKERWRIKAWITTDHPDASYGQPVIVLPDGSSLGSESWVSLGYQVVTATKHERELVNRILERWTKERM